MRRALVMLGLLAACADPPLSAPDVPLDPDPTGRYPDAETIIPDVPEGPDAGRPPPTYWDDVRPVIEKRCIFCHDTSRPPGAPPLATYADTQAESSVAGQTVAARMGKRILDPAGNPGDIPPAASDYARRMTLAERQTIAAWANAGAPEGIQPDAGRPPPDDDAATPPDDAGATD